MAGLKWNDLTDEPVGALSWDSLSDTPTNDQGDVARGFTRAFAQVPELAYGTGALAAMSAEKLFGEGGLSTAAKNYFGSKYAEKHAANEQYAPTVEFTDAWDAIGTNPGKMADWIQDSAGYVVGQGLQTIATGGIGALAGKMTLGSLVAGSAAKAADKMVAAEIAKRGLVGEAAEAAAAAMLPTATAAAARNLSMALGSGIVLTGQNLGMEAGDIYGGLLEESKKTGKEITGSDLVRAWGAAGLAAGTETVTDLLGLGALTGRIKIGNKAIQEMTGVGGRAARAGVGAGVGSIIEGSQEWVQTGLEQWGAGSPLDTPEAAKERINAAAVGALGGTIMGGGAGALAPHATVADIGAAPNADVAIATAEAALAAPVDALAPNVAEFQSDFEANRVPADSAVAPIGVDLQGPPAPAPTLALPTDTAPATGPLVAPLSLTSEQIVATADRLAGMPVGAQTQELLALDRPTRQAVVKAMQPSGIVTPTVLDAGQGQAGILTNEATTAASSVQPVGDASATNVPAYTERAARKRVSKETGMEMRPHRDVPNRYEVVPVAPEPTSNARIAPPTLAIPLTQQQLAEQEMPVAPATRPVVPAKPLTPAQLELNRMAADAERSSLPRKSIFRNSQLRDADAPDIKGEKVTHNMRRFLTQIGKLTGTKVVFEYAPEDSEGAVPIRGENVIHINTAAQINPLQVMGHEVTHVLKDRHREAWTTIRDALVATMPDKRAALDAFAEDYWHTHPDRLEAARAMPDWSQKLTPEQMRAFNSGENTIEAFLLDELTSDLGGSHWSSEQFWTDVFAKIEKQHGGEKAKGIIQRLVASIKEALSKFLMVVHAQKQGDYTTVTPEQLEKTRDAVTSAYAKFINEERTATPEHSPRTLDRRIRTSDVTSRSQGTEPQQAVTPAAAPDTNDIDDLEAAREDELSQLSPQRKDQRLFFEGAPKSDEATVWNVMSDKQQRAVSEARKPVLDALQEIERGKLTMDGEYGYNTYRSLWKEAEGLRAEYPDDTQYDIYKDLGGTGVVYGNGGYNRYAVMQDGTLRPIPASFSNKDTLAKAQAALAAPVARMSEQRKPVDTESAEFKRWFGDSKVVDANGKPLRVYHGTNKNFLSFNTTKKGTEGSFFAEDPLDANLFSSEQWHDKRGTPNVIPVYLAIKNPAAMSDIAEINKDGLKSAKQLRSILIAKGFDGIIKPHEMIVFYPTQIKSAISNTGEFSSTNPDIRRSETRPPSWYYSPLARAAESATMKTAPASGWKDWLKSLPAKGVKPDEIKWSGIEEWLDVQGKMPVTKQQVQSFLSDFGIKVETILRGERNPRNGEAVSQDIDADEEPADLDIRFGEWETDEPDESWLYDSASERLEEEIDERVEQEKGDIEDELRDHVEANVTPESHVDDIRSDAGTLFPLTDDELDAEARRRAAMDYAAEHWQSFADDPDITLDTDDEAAVATAIERAFDVAMGDLAALETEAERRARAEIDEDKLLEELVDREREYYYNDYESAATRSISVDGVDGTFWHTSGYGDQQLTYDGNDIRLPHNADNADIEGTIRAYLDENGLLPDGVGPSDGTGFVPTKWDGYTTDKGRAVPGSYREVQLTLPPGTHGEVKSRPDPMGVSRGEAGAITERADATDFKYTTHWNELNVLGHARFDEHIDSDGKRVMVLQEIQGDWGQQRREGVEAQERAEVLIKQIDAVGDEGAHAIFALKQILPDAESGWTSSDWNNVRSMGSRALSNDVSSDAKVAADKIAKLETDRRDLQREYDALRRDTPEPAPFIEKTVQWAGLVMKRMIAHAIEYGFDKVVWTNGAQQVERWRSSLRKEVDTIAWEKTPEGIHIRASKNGNVRSDTRLAETVLSDHIGKTMAKQIISDPNQSGEITGNDITVSDTGMAGFYDRMLPNVANDILKKLDKSVRVGMHEVHPVRQYSVAPDPDTDGRWIVQQDGKELVSHPTKERAEENVEKLIDSKAATEIGIQQGFEITDKLKESAVNGLPLMSERRRSAETRKADNRRAWYYSQLSVAVNDIPRKIKTGKEAALWLQSNAAKLGVKKDELVWSGVLDWLAAQPAPAGVNDWLRDNGVRVREVVLGEESAEYLRLDAELQEQDAEVSRLRKNLNIVKFVPTEAMTASTKGDAKTLTEMGFNRYQIDAMLAYGRALNRKNELFEQRNAARGEPVVKYEAHALPGGSRYRELLLTLPTGREKLITPRMRELEAKSQLNAAERAELGRLVGSAFTESEKLPTFTSGHFPGHDNIIVHLRFNERTDADGKRVLFIEEVQSDYAQAGRRERKKIVAAKAKELGITEEAASKLVPASAGFGITPRYSVIDKDGYVRGDFKSREEAEEYRKNPPIGMDKIVRPDSEIKQTGTAGVPAAPFVTDTKAWTALALKRAIAYAVDNGFDRVAWTTGEQQAERYDLSKQVASINYDPVDEWLTAYPKDSGRDNISQAAKLSELEGIIGKEAAKKIEQAIESAKYEREQWSVEEDDDKFIVIDPNGDPRYAFGGDLETFDTQAEAEEWIDANYNDGQTGVTISGLDLKVGGEGMRGFYDQIVPQVARSLGATMGEVNIPQDKYNGYVDYVVGNGVHNDFAVLGVKADGERVILNQNARDIMHAREMVADLKRKVAGEPQPGFDITPRMKEQAQIGMPLFSERRRYMTDLTPDDITTNPSASKLIGLLRRSHDKALRYVLDKDSNFYWWDAYKAVHPDGAAAAGIAYDYTRRGGLYLNADGSVEFTNDFGVKAEDLKRYMTGDTFLFYFNGHGAVTGAEARDLVDEGNATIQRSERRAPTDNQQQWAGRTVVRNEDGSLRVMYHGTARDITMFRPQQADVIFLTDDPEFAANFADLSHSWMVNNYWTWMTPDQIQQAKRDAMRMLLKDALPGSSLYMREERLLNQSQQQSQYMRRAVEPYMPSESNVMPLYVRAENPFDYRNPKHVAAIEAEIGTSWMGQEVINGEMHEVSQHIGDLERGDWNAIEGPQVQAYIRQHHDSFYVRERGVTNLAVFSPNQVKSASGNTGAYSREDADIRRSEPRQVIIDGAAEIAKMSDAVRDDLDPTNAPGGWHAYEYYEAQKLLPKPSEKLKKLTDRNTFILGQDNEYLANVDGIYFGVNKWEDPDDTDDDTKFVYAFNRLDDPLVKPVQTTTDQQDELFAEMRKYAGDTARQSTPRSRMTGQPINQSWTDPVVTDWDDLVRKMQDDKIDTKRVLKAIRDAGIAIKEKFDAYLLETNYHGRAAARVYAFADGELRKLMEDMAMRKLSMSDLDDYLWARHAPERNAQNAKSNPAITDGSGMSDAQSAAILAGQAVTVGTRTIQLTPAALRAATAVASRVDAITSGTLDLLVSYGLETQQTVDTWKRTYAHYAPLKRDMESDSNYSGAFNLGNGSGAGFDVRGAASRRALGSKRAVTDVLANIAMQRERAITRGEKNRVSQAVYGLALSAPNPEFWIPVNTDLNQRLTPAALVKVVAELVSIGVNPIDAQNLAREPVQRYIDPKTGLESQRINPALRGRDTVLSTRINGEDRYVFFSNKKRAQEMVRGLKNLDAADVSGALQVIAPVTRWFAAINTQYNPVFGLTNGVRDFSTGMLNLSSTPLSADRAAVAKYAFSALRGIYADLRDHRAGRTPTSQWAQLFEQFELDGGRTGYRDMFATSTDRAEAIAKELEHAGKGKQWVFGGEKHSAVFGWLSDYNTAVENAMRLAAYKAALDKGMSRDAAASLAKNLTVNFNKRGLAATQTGALYAFFNAAVQGTARIAETISKDGKLTTVGQKIVYGGMMVGVMQAVMGALAEWDDDEPPQFQREKNFIIPIFGTDKYASIPMPLGFHVLPNIGRVTTEWMMSGFKDPGKRLVRLAGVVLDAFNPIGSGTLAQTLSPTIGDPIIALAENEDWTGKSIYKADFDKLHPTPGWTRTKDTASPPSKFLSYWINYVTGGGKYEIGMASPTPDQIDYLVGQATGGTGRELLKTAQYGASKLTGEELPIYKTPLGIGRFVGETKGQSSEMSRFYRNLERIGEHKSALREMKDAGDGAAMQAYLAENPDARMVQTADKAQREIAYLRRQKREVLEKGGNAERVKMLDERITAMAARYNQVLRGR